jgi:heme oxygenase (mycobilin-producing)
VLVVVRLRAPADAVQTDSFQADVRAAIDALAARPGHLSSRLARALDDPDTWVLVSEWENVGSYRRAIGSYEFKLASVALMMAAMNEPSAFEVVESVSADPG